MSAIYKNGQFYANGIEENKTVTSAEFTAMSQAQKDNGTAWYVEDGEVVSNFTVLGNRFDKANIYTENERMVGSWMGKPLYQKTAEFTVALNNSWQTVLSLGADANIVDYHGIQIKSDGQGVESNTQWQQVNVTCNYPNVGDLSISNPTPLGGTFCVTVKYTKTSDGTVNIGTGNDYSTDEQIIGTWIDGKKLYQKTVAVSIPTLAAKSSTDYDIDTDTTHELRSSEACYYRSDGMVFNVPRITINNNDGSSNQAMNIQQSATNGKIILQIRTVPATTDSGTMYCTIRYTKTTD